MVTYLLRKIISVFSGNPLKKTTLLFGRYHALGSTSVVNSILAATQIFYGQQVVVFVVFVVFT